MTFKVPFSFDGLRPVQAPMDIFFSLLHSEKIEGSNGAATPSARKWPFSSSQSFRISFLILNWILGSRSIMGCPQIPTLLLLGLGHLLG